MVVRVHVRTTFEDDARFARDVAKKAAPLAMRNTLNDTAFAVRREVVGPLWESSFNVRNRRFPRAAFRVEKATLAKRKSALFERFDKQFVRLQASGGTKRPRKAGRLAIPLRYVRARRTSTGKIPKRLSPKGIQKRPDKFEEDGLIYIRPRRKPAVPLYLLRRSVEIPQRFDFFETCKRFGSLVFARLAPINFEKSVALVNRRSRLR